MEPRINVCDERSTIGGKLCTVVIPPACQAQSRAGAGVVDDNGAMLDPRVLDNHELDAELAVLKRGRDASMDEGAQGAELAEADALIEKFEAEIRHRHEQPQAD